MKILIDAGHGGKESGAIGNGLIEKELNLIIADYLKESLYNNGFQYVMTRQADIYLDLSKRVVPCDISISIHINANKGQGHEIWHSEYNKGKESKRLALLINQAICDKLPDVKNRGLKSRKSKHGNYDYLYMLRKPTGIPVLVECGFIDNVEDAKALKNFGKLRLFAEGICRGLKEYRKEINDVKKA